MGVSSVDAEAMFEDQVRLGNYKPLESVATCNTRGCNRPIYGEKKCKRHYDMAWYVKTIKQQRKAQ